MSASIVENHKTDGAFPSTSEHRDEEARPAARRSQAHGPSRSAVPTEVIRILNPHSGRPELDDSPVRSRAGMLAAWLREGGERSDLPPLPTETPSPTLERDAAKAVAGARIDALPRGARQLALRLQLLRSEIVEQSYGPSRRWAILDVEGETLETPAAEDVAALKSNGFLALSHFEKGAAVWRLQSAATEGRAAYCDVPARPRRRAS